jgi:hypothetical protein
MARLLNRSFTKNLVVPAPAGIHLRIPCDQMDPVLQRGDGGYQFADLYFPRTDSIGPQGGIQPKPSR